MSGQQIGSVVGGIIGYYFGNVQAGVAIGGLIGGAIDPTKVKGPSIGDATKQTSQAGVPRPVCYGHPAPFMGNIIDGETKARKIHKKVKQGKGSGVVNVEEHFLLTSAVRVCEGPIGGIVRIWRNKKVVVDRRPLNQMPGFDGPNAAAVAQYYYEIQAQTSKFMQLCFIYLGGEDQLPCPALEAIHGVNNTPAYRGTAYIVVIDNDVTDVGGACAEYMFEVLSCGIPNSYSDGDIYVGNNSGSDPAYYIFDGVNNELTFTSSHSATKANYITISGTRDRLYFGDDGGGKCGHYVLADDSKVTYDSASGYMVTDGGGNAYVGTPLGNDIRQVSTETGEEGNTASICSFGELGGMYMSPGGGEILLAMYGGIDGSTTIPYAIYSPGSNTCITYAIPDRTASRGIALNTHNSKVYVTCANGAGTQAHLLACSGGTVIDDISLGESCSQIAVRPDGKELAIANVDLTNGAVFILDADDYHPIASLEVGAHAQHGLTYNAAGTRLYVASGNGVLVFDTENYTEIAEVSTPGDVFGIACWPPTNIPVDWPQVPGSGEHFIDPITGQVINADGEITTLTDCGSITLREVEEDIAARCNVPPGHLDFSELIDIIPGYLISQQFTGAECLLPLCSGFFHDLPEVDNQIVARYRGGASVVTITDDECLDTGDDDENTRGQALEYPLRVSVITQEPEAEFSPIPQTSWRFSPDVKPSSEVSVQLPIPFGADIAKRCAVKMHKVLWAQAEGRIELSLPEEFSRLIISDPITYLGKRWLIVEANYADGEVNIKANYDRASAYTSAATGTTGDPVTPPGTSLAGPSRFAWLNVSMLSDSEDKIGFYVAVAGYLDGWHGAVVQASVDGGTTFIDIADIDNACVMGSTLTALPAAEADTIDWINTVRVRVSDELDSITMAELFKERNACVIGEELCQFQTATFIEAGVYDLSVLTRGRLNSTPATHAVGSRFVLLNAPVFCEVPASWIGQTITLQAVSKGETEAAQFDRTWTMALVQTEWSPYRFEGERDTAGDITFSWIGRARMGSNANPFHSSFFTGYRVGFTKDTSTTIYKPLTSLQSFTYTAAEQIADFGDATGPIDISIEAMNRITGASEALTATLA